MLSFILSTIFLSLIFYGIYHVVDNGWHFDKTHLDPVEIERQVIFLTNQERNSYGLYMLPTNTALSDVARAHSSDMATNNYFEHISLTNTSPSNRGQHICYGVSENIYLMDSGSTEYEVAKNLVDGWMNSKGHRENILYSTYDSIGVGIVISGTDVYATQNFCLV